MKRNIFYYIVLLFMLLTVAFYSLSYGKMYRLEFIWDKNTETDLAGYDFYEGDPNMDINWIINPNIPADANTIIIDANIPVGNTSYYAIKAFNDKGNESGFSNIVPFLADNMAPVADAQNISTFKNKSIDITLTASDYDKDTLTFSVYSNPLHGVLSGIPPNLKYSPALDFVGLDNFTFRVNDGTVNSNISTISIAVKDIPPNSPSKFRLKGCLPFSL